MPLARFLIVVLPAAFAAFRVGARDIAIKLKSEDESFQGFDSDARRTEKIVAAKGKVTIKLEPLAAGRYPFRGEFHDATAQGVPVVE
jgi:Cupredoxin-like domain